MVDLKGDSFELKALKKKKKKKIAKENPSGVHSATIQRRSVVYQT